MALSLTTMWDGGAFPVDAQHLTDLLNIDSSRTPEYATQFSSPRYRIVDHDLNPVPTGDQGPLGDDGDITQFVQTCTIQLDSSQSVAGTATIVFEEAVGFVFDPTLHYVQVFADYWADREMTVLLGEWPVGIFRFVYPDRNLQDTTTMWSAALVDLSSEIQNVYFVNTYTAAANALFTDVMRTLLTMDAIPLGILDGTGQTPSGLPDAGPGFPSSRVNIAASALAIPAAIPWDRNTTKMAAINGLADTIRYVPVWVDAMGVAQSFPYPNFSESNPPIVWTYTNADASSSIIGAVAETWTDQTKLANLIVVEALDPTGATLLSSIQANATSTSSRISLARIGKAMMQPVVHLDYVPGKTKAEQQANLDAYAQLQLQIYATLAEQVTFTAPINPVIQLWDCIDVTYVDPITGETLLSSDRGFQVLALSYDLTAWTMQITAGRVIAV